MQITPSSVYIRQSNRSPLIALGTFMSSDVAKKSPPCFYRLELAVSELKNLNTCRRVLGLGFQTALGVTGS